MLDYITSFVDRNGYEPSYQQIAQRLGVSSKGGIQRHIVALENQGLLARRRTNGSFGIEIPSKSMSSDLVCSIELIEVDGNGSFLVVERSPMPIPRFMLGEIPAGEVFAYKVVDDSMIEQQICEDDIVVLEKRNYARRGQTVVVETADGETRLGMFHNIGTEVELRCANPDFDAATFPADEVTVLGVMRGLLRPAASHSH